MNSMTSYTEIHRLCTATCSQTLSLLEIAHKHYSSIMSSKYESLCAPLWKKHSPQRKAIKALLKFHFQLVALESHLISNDAYIRAIEYVQKNLPAHASVNGPLVVLYDSWVLHFSPTWKIVVNRRELCSTLVVYLLSQSRTFASQTPEQILTFFSDRYDAFERIPRARMLKLLRTLIPLCQPHRKRACKHVP